jgi:hypothetical protein
MGGATGWRLAAGCRERLSGPSFPLGKRHEELQMCLYKMKFGRQPP